MWRRFFRFRMVPGVMIHPRFGKIDFRRDDLDVEMLRQIVEAGSYYLELTPEGQREFYGVEVQERIEKEADQKRVRKKKEVS
jgi:hypothetical protein